jgi:hypothetical protein
LVERTSSIIDCKTRKLAEIHTASHPSTPETGGKAESQAALDQGDCLAIA